MKRVRIDKDHNNFKKVVKGKIKKNLKRYISHGEMIGRKGKDLVSIPIPRIDLPRFRYGSKETGGVGQGEGKIGTPIGRGDGQEKGQAGDAPGEHVLEVDVSLDELAEMLGEELELPRIEPKGKKVIPSKQNRYTTISSEGPESLRHFKRTYRKALKRQISEGLYNPIDPKIIPIKDDKKYKARKTVMLPEASAVIFYMMDVSGSMGDQQKEIVRLTSFWMDTWLRSQYDNIETRYVIHDAIAKEVDRERFYNTRESGGTIISSGYKLISKIIKKEYPLNDWNIYVFQFSDGDNWGDIDNSECSQLLRRDLIPMTNLFGYGQVKSPYGSGSYIGFLEEEFIDDIAADDLAVCQISDKDDIMFAIKHFLGKGR